LIDRRLFRELKNIRLYWPKTTMAAFAIVVFTLLLNDRLAALVNAVLMDIQGDLRPGDLQQFLIKSAALLIVWLSAKSVALGLADHYARQVGQQIKRLLRERLAGQFIVLGPVRLKSERIAVLSTVFQEGVDSIEPYYADFVPQLVLTAIALPMVLGVVLYYDWISGLIMLLTAPLIPLFMVMIGKLSAAVSARQWRELKHLNDHFLDVLRGLKTLHLFGRAERQAAVVGQAADFFRRTTIGVLKVSFLSALTLELSATLSTAVIAVSLGVRLLYGKLDFFPAFLILLLAPEYYQPLRQLGAKFHTATGAKSATDAIASWLQTTADEPSSTTSTTSTTSAINTTRSTSKECKSITRQAPPGGVSLELRAVDFAYQADQQVLLALNLKIPAGQHVALTGPSGGGKTTLAALVLGFLRPQVGSVLIDNTDLVEFPQDQLNRWIAYMPQYPRLFADSLWNNLTLGQPAAEETEVLTLLDELGLTELVQQLPQGLQTRVGQGGQPLSGGQVQRLGLARALLQHAPLLILDEPTSALDPNTETFIHSTLERRLRQTTLLTIAHRLSTIQQSDRIIYLDSGQIVEDGSHAQLLTQNGLYSRLIQIAEADQ
jgi:thiol reductant ABC exporter CydD subunit